MPATEEHALFLSRSVWAIRLRRRRTCNQHDDGGGGGGGGGRLFLACEDFGRMFDKVILACVSFSFFFKVEINSRTLIPLFRPGSVAQRAETTVTECSLTSCVRARFLTSSQTVPGQRHCQPTPISLGQRCMRALGSTCHLHFWQNDRGLLRVTAVTRGGTDTE